ncbi:TIGR02679 family protein [Castellaniella hirudinis]|uniref:TIGR02679 family protein n=1 Tax=Castellaniella hirudinis TaxID=1144617 RepID=UPI0039C0BA46
MTAPDERLSRLLGGPALARLRQRLRRHYERHPAGHAPPTLQLSGLTALEQERLAELMGRPVRAAGSLRIDLARIDAALRQAGICDSLRDALARLDGPIADRMALRQASQRAWDQLSTGRIGPPTAPEATLDPRLLAWLRTPGALTLVKRLSQSSIPQAQDLLRRAHAVMRCLPAKGMPRAQLAAQTLGDAHSLDTGQPVARIILAAWPAADAPDDRERDRDRDIWARAGVLVNELARPALFLNLPVRDAACRTWIPGEPAYLSLRQLLRRPPAWQVAQQPVFLCENPNLLAIAASELGPACPPLACTDGMPAAAQRTLLDQLSAAGARLHYHGDFDWPGLRIANHILARWPAQAWRMRGSDYEAAVRQAPSRPADLGEQIVQARWDADLADQMRHHGLKIAEEAVASVLLADLSACAKHAYYRGN